MPSFLSKVFGRKKDDNPSAPFPTDVSDASLLDGHFETVTPSAVEFPHVENGKGEENEKGKQKEAGGPFALFFKPKSRSASPEPPQRRAPHLSLHFSNLKDEAIARALALGVVLERDEDLDIILSDEVIGGRRLNSVEALNLVRTCSQAIIDRGMSHHIMRRKTDESRDKASKPSG